MQLGKEVYVEPERNQWKKGCRSRFLRYGLVLIILAFLVLVVLPFASATFRRSEQLRQWEGFGIDSYSITLEVSGPASIACLGPYESVRLKVIDNEIVDIQGERFDTDNLERYRSCTIDGLFEQAKNCIVFCKVKYDSVYGFPTQFSVGFIEGGVLSVVDFQPLDPDTEY